MAREQRSYVDVAFLQVFVRIELIERALKVEAENAKALQLAGSAAFQAKDYKKAIDYWQRVLKQVPPNSEVGQTISERIEEAKTLAGGK